MKRGRMPIRWAGHLLGLVPPYTGTTASEQEALRRWATGRTVLVEVGSDEGLNSLNLRKAMRESAVLYLVDPYAGGRLGVSFSYLIAKREVAKCDRGTVRFVRLRSHEAAVQLDLAVDFLFVDGDHAYERVIGDWNDWAPKLVPGGVAVFHDSRVFEGGWTLPDAGPVRLMEEIRSGRQRIEGMDFEFVDVADSLSVLRRRL